MNKAELIAAQRIEHAYASHSLMPGPGSAGVDVLRTEQPSAFACSALPSRP